MGVVIGRACLPDLRCNLPASQPERVLGISLHKHVDLFRADSYRAFADASPAVMVASPSSLAFFGPSRLINARALSPAVCIKRLQRAVSKLDAKRGCLFPARFVARLRQLMQHIPHEARQVSL